MAEHPDEEQYLDLLAETLGLDDLTTVALERAAEAGGLAGVADLPPVQDHGMAEPDPGFPRHERHEVALDLIRVGLIAQPHAIC